jgi:CHAD domain-containing protein
MFIGFWAVRPEIAFKLFMAESIAELLAFAVSKNWTHYRMCLKKCQKKPGTKAVHDLRTSIRRLLAALRLSEEILVSRKKKIERVRRVLKVELNLVRSLRDHQVQVITLKKKEEFGTISKFVLKEAKSEQKEVSRCLRKKLAPKIEKTEKRLLRLHADLLDHAEVERDQTTAFHFLTSAHRELLTTAKKAQLSDPASVHRVRIQFKKFRYGREVLAPVLRERGKERRNRADELDKIQTALGDIQDHETMIQTAEHFLTKERSLPKSKRDRATQEGQRLIAMESLEKTRLMEQLLGDIEVKLREIKPVRKLQSA